MTFAPLLVPQLAQLGLRLRLLCRRFGWGNGMAALLLLAGCVTCLWLVPQLKMRDAVSQADLEKAKTTLAATPTLPAAPTLPPSEIHAQQFQEILGDSRYAEQQVKTLFAVAAKNGLSLNQAEYKFAANQAGMFHTYSIALPVKGQYASIRAFCEQVLVAIPFASLDQIEFKREAINSPLLEAKIRFTLYLDQTGSAKKHGEGGES